MLTGGLGQGSTVVTGEPLQPSEVEIYRPGPRPPEDSTTAVKRRDRNVGGRARDGYDRLEPSAARHAHRVEPAGLGTTQDRPTV